MKKVRYFSFTTAIIFLLFLFFTSDPLSTKNVASGPVRMVSKSEWTNLTTGGERFGYKKAPITIVEFVDFQCPDCQRFVGALTRYRQEHPKQIKVIVHNFPLTQHPQARMAAISAICVSKMGNYEKYYHLLFQNQYRLSSQPWDSLARLAGVKDIKAFNNRLKTDKKARRMIKNSQQLGLSIGLMETPTIIINRLMYSGPLTYQQLSQAVKQQLNSPG